MERGLRLDGNGNVIWGGGSGNVSDDLVKHYPLALGAGAAVQIYDYSAPPDPSVASNKFTTIILTNPSSAGASIFLGNSTVTNTDFLIELSPGDTFPIEDFRGDGKYPSQWYAYSVAGGTLQRGFIG